MTYLYWLLIKAIRCFHWLLRKARGFILDPPQIHKTFSWLLYKFSRPISWEKYFAPTVTDNTTARVANSRVNWVVVERMKWLAANGIRMWPSLIESQAFYHGPHCVTYGIIQSCTGLYIIAIHA